MCDPYDMAAAITEEYGRTACRRSVFEGLGQIDKGV